MSQSYQPVVALGLMSGTSADGVDAALIRTDGEDRIDFLEAVTVPYSRELRTDLLRTARNDVPIMDVLSLEKRLTDAHVDACQSLLKSSDSQFNVDVIGFHGHTIRHNASLGLTWQLGDAALLATATTSRVVHDFRRADIAVGGQGAPLAPLFHRHLLVAIEKPAIILNLGGVANITWLGSNGAIRAGDTGPGCGLLDAWTEKRIDRPYDQDGQLASTGVVHQDVVNAALQHKYFRRELPKSADRYDFDFVNVEELSPADGAATLCALTAEAVCLAVDRLPERAEFCWVTGGGAKHPLLMQLLRQRLGHAEPVSQLGFEPEYLEAQCFAWLAVRRLRQLPTSVPETTGCRQPTCGGAMTEAL